MKAKPEVFDSRGGESAAAWGVITTKPPIWEQMARESTSNHSLHPAKEETTRLIAPRCTALAFTHCQHLERVVCCPVR